MKNWKTSIAGILVILITVATTLGWITPAIAAAITSLLVSLGLMAAKDNNVTGGTTPQ